MAQTYSNWLSFLANLSSVSATPAHSRHYPPSYRASPLLWPPALCLLQQQAGSSYHHQVLLSLLPPFPQGIAQRNASLISPLLQPCHQVISTNCLCCIFLQCRINALLGCILRFWLQKNLPFCCVSHIIIWVLLLIIMNTCNILSCVTRIFHK